jgi:hypothetical protein
MMLTMACPAGEDIRDQRAGPLLIAGPAVVVKIGQARGRAEFTLSGRGRRVTGTRRERCLDLR